jgi:hypothetical protein
MTFASKVIDYVRRGPEADAGDTTLQWMLAHWLWWYHWASGIVLIAALVLALQAAAVYNANGPGGVLIGWVAMFGAWIILDSIEP